MVFAGITAGLIGALLGAVLIAAAILVAFRLFGMQIPRFANLWKAAFLASAGVIVADGLGTALLPETLAAIVVLAVGLSTGFFAYATVLQTPSGETMGHRAAALALATHAVFSLAMFVFVFPVVMGALT
jgi:hypothetical protein